MNIKITLVIFTFLFCFQLLASDYTPSECPVVGNIDSKIYHIPGGESYAKMLRKNKKGDNRKCFKNEAEALGAGYRKAKR